MKKFEVVDFKIVLEGDSAVIKVPSENTKILIDTDINLISYLNTFQLVKSTKNGELKIRYKKSTKVMHNVSIANCVYGFYNGESLTHVRHISEINKPEKDFDYDFRLANLRLVRTIKKSRKDFYMNTYTKLDNQVVELTINSKKPESPTFKVLLDKDAVEHCKQFKWGVYSNKPSNVPKYLKDQLESGSIDSTQINFYIGRKSNAVYAIESLLSELAKYYKKPHLYTKKIALNNVYDFTSDNLTENKMESFFSDYLVSENFREKSIQYSRERFSEDYNGERAKVSMEIFRDKSVLSFEIVEQIRNDYATGEYTIKDLAEKYNQKISNLKTILQYRTWNPYEVVNHNFSLDDLNEINIPLSNAITQQNLTFKLRADIPDHLFSFENSEFKIFMHKPVDFQIYLKIYENDNFIGTAQVYLLSKEEILNSRKVSSIINCRIISFRIKGKQYKQAFLYRFLNSISDYFYSK